MERRYSIYHLLVYLFISITTLHPSPSGAFSSAGESSKKLQQQISTSSSSSSASYSSSSSSNDVYPRTRNTSFEFQQVYQLVNELFTEEDSHFDTKILPPDKEVSTKLLKNKSKRLFFPLLSQGPLTIIVTPCSSPLSWTLSYRPYPSKKIEEDTPTSKTPNSSLAEDFDDDNTIKYDLGRSGVRNSLDSSRSSSVQRRSARSSTSNVIPDLKEKLYSEKKQNTESNEFGMIENIISHDHEYHNTIDQAIEESDEIKTSTYHKHLFQKLTRRKRRAEVHDRILKKYEGYEIVVYQNQSLPKGLYILTVKALHGPTNIHVQAKRKWLPPPVSAHVSTVSSPERSGITLKWASSISGTGYCLVISEGRRYPSLCAAEAAREGELASNFPKSKAKRRRNHKRKYSKGKRRITNPMLIVGCINQNWYWLPSAPFNTLHISVWEEGVAGPPLGTGVIRPSRRVKVPRLKPGKLMTLVPSPGGTSAVKFKIRRRGRSLHIMALSCGAKLRLNIETRSGQSLGKSAGGPGAMHMVLRDLPKASITFSLKTEPPSAENTILVAAAHSSRYLPLPRLPRRDKVMALNITCTSALIKWFKAPGNVSYCVLVERLNDGANWRNRAPRQCGWEAVLGNTENYIDKWCGPAIKSKRQNHWTEVLSPDNTYLVTVLVRHSVTGRTLSLPQKKFQTPDCSLL